MLGILLSLFVIFPSLVFGTGTLSKNGILIGFIPDITGDAQPLAPLNDVLARHDLDSAATYGWYAQVYAGVPWTGTQLLDIKADVIQSGAIFQPAVMPVGSYWGFTAANKQQAVAVAKVLREFTDANVTVQLRFAHEANWYSTAAAAATDTVHYEGGDDRVELFKNAWLQVYAACKKYAPEVKLVWSPNNATLAELETWAPAAGTYDYVALDYYPTDSEQASAEAYISFVKPFHDKFTSDAVKFVIAETGFDMLGITTPRKVKWLKVLLSSTIRQALPNYVSLTWFNVDKTVDYRILSANGTHFNKASLALLEASNSEARSARSLQDVNASSGRGERPQAYSGRRRGEGHKRRSHRARQH